ncbi:APC family permease [Nocardioides bruguierae]|uniref:APC family permease n=1 Tax=Nocardioides bruguierae TaxID=2945102 RepID=A0A9X2IEQ4_9ACTN|nr:APC family permease [Nocardioides bruguierae]MCM0621066.1 APC family permease [Nocardioides bruguierae]
MPAPSPSPLLRRSPVSGLARRTMAFPEVLAQSVAAVAPSAVMVTVPAVVHPVAGAWSALVFALVAVLMTGVGAAVNVFAGRMVGVSGLYGFTVRGLGPGPGVVAGAAMAIGYGGAACVGVLGAGQFGLAALDDGARLLGSPPGPLGDPGPGLSAVAAVLAAVGVVVLLVRGVRASARAVLVTETVAITVVLVVLVVVAASDLSISAGLTTALAPGQWGVALLLATMAFVGFESSTTLASESRQPMVTVPRAVRWTPLVAASLYVVASLLFGADLAAGGTSDRLAWSLAGGDGAPALELLLNLGITASWVACALGSVTALARIVFTMAREGLLPPVLGRVSAASGTPSAAIVLVGAHLAVVPAVLLLVGFSVPALFVLVMTMSAFGYLLGYVLVCLAAPALLGRLEERTQLGAVVPRVVAGVLVVIVLWGAATGGAWAVGGFVAYGLVVGAALALWRRRARRRGLALGLYDEPTRADVLRPDAPGAHRSPGTRP